MNLLKICQKFYSCSWLMKLKARHTVLSVHNWAHCREQQTLFKCIKNHKKESSMKLHMNYFQSFHVMLSFYLDWACSFQFHPLSRKFPISFIFMKTFTPCSSNPLKVNFLSSTPIQHTIKFMHVNVVYTFIPNRY